jgi:exonuclease SbcC
MLLKKIRLRNFISHRARNENGNGGFTEIDLNSSRLWLIHGENGSGKSSLWDALTFALFRQHRGGAKKFEQLIHHAEDEAAIQLEFRLGDTEYQIVSTITRDENPKRKRKDGDAKAKSPNVSAKASDVLNYWDGNGWELVKGTKGKVKEWVTQNIKLTYETFTSSVLLLQGKADAFLVALPSERKDRLIETLQLDIYKQLSKKANKRKAKTEDERDHLRHSLQGLPLPSAKDIEEQERTVTETEVLVEQAQSTLSKKKDELTKVREAAEKRTEIRKKRQQQEKYRKLVAEDKEIERHVAEFRKLKDAWPRLESLWEARHELNVAEEKLSESSDKTEKIAAQLKGLAPKVQRSKEKEASADAALKKAESDNERFAELSQAIYWLDELQTATSQFKTAQERREEIKREIAGLEEKESQLAAEVNSLKDVVAKIEEEGKGISEELESCRRELAVSRRGRETKNEISGKDECPTCGTELKNSEAQKRLAHQLAHLDGEISRLENTEERLLKEQAEKRQAYKNADKRKRNTEESQRGVQTNLAVAKRSIDDNTEDVSRAEQLVERRNAQAGVWVSRLAKLGALIEEKNTLSGSGHAKADAATALNVARGERESLERDQLELKGKLETERRLHDETKRHRDGVVEKFERRRYELPDEWAQHEACESEETLNRLRLRLNELQGSEEKEAQLREALKNREQLEAEINLLESQINPEHDRPLPAVEAEYENAKLLAVKSNKAREEARERLKNLERQKSEAEIKQKELETAERSLSYWKRLSDDFGANGLQAAIVKQALATIAANANKTLSNLTNGEWQVEFEELADNQLEINALNLVQGFSRTFKFISGGERFCVAVSIAIAIGQTLQEGRAVDTLIIDEGFGQLDNKHRDGLIVELERLSNEVFQNGRIIVVSHQEDVHDKFGCHYYHILKGADGYVQVRSG